MIPVFTGAGLRVVAPDLIGFGRSDKPADPAWHTFDKHRSMLMRFVERLDLKNILLVCQDWGGLLGLTLPHEMPGRFTRLLVMNTTLGTGQVTEGFRQWRAYSNSQGDLPVGKLFARGKADMTQAEAAAYDAPFPDAQHKAALKAFPNLVPDGDDAPGAAISRRAREFWRNEWTGDSFMAIGMKDPVLGEAPMRALQRDIRNCPSPLEVSEGGHFVQEWGAPIARAALQRFGLAAKA
jgi:pimeloyl-ACP methyl ester carboxylesterase